MFKINLKYIYKPSTRMMKIVKTVNDSWGAFFIIYDRNELIMVL